MENNFLNNEKPPTFSGKKLPSGIDWFDKSKDSVFPELIPDKLNIEMCRKRKIQFTKTIVFLNSGLPPDEKTCHYDINWKNKL